MPAISTVFDCGGGDTSGVKVLTGGGWPTSAGSLELASTDVARGASSGTAANGLSAKTVAGSGMTGAWIVVSAGAGSVSVSSAAMASIAMGASGNVSAATLTTGAGTDRLWPQALQNRLSAGLLAWQAGQSRVSVTAFVSAGPAATVMLAPQLRQNLAAGALSALHCWQG
jgi:hypothetical protein